jgi:peptide chain release factor
MFPLSGPKAQALAARMERLGIREEDLTEHFVRSGGKGGQNVNKVSTCVVLEHQPTKTLVKCQLERSQALNRYRARQLLADKIEGQLLGQASAETQRIARIRRQKRRRSQRAKEKMLQTKHVRAQTKALRQRVTPDSE